MKNYKIELELNASKQTILNALNAEIGNWWGTYSQPYNNNKKIFRVSWDSSYWSFENIHNSSNKIIWKCVESNQEDNFTGMDEEWLNTEIEWIIEEIGDKTRLSFTHYGLTPKSACYDICSAGWDFYLTKSLVNYVETGKGNPGQD